MSAEPPSGTLQTELEDILASLQFARRSEDLGRLAWLTYWDVRRWARAARFSLLAERAEGVITEHPRPTRADFLRLVDGVISEMQSIRGQWQRAPRAARRADMPTDLPMPSGSPQPAGCA